MSAIATQITWPTQDQMEQECGRPAAEWAGQCHGISMALVALLNRLNEGEAVATVRRGLYTGEVAPGSYFDGRPCQHSWVVLRDGTVADPTRFAFTNGPTWPIWTGDDTDYDVGSCRSTFPYSDPPNFYESEGEPIDLDLGSTEYVADLLGLPPECIGEDADWVNISREQAMWLANLPVKKTEGSGQLHRFFAAEVYEALIKADCGEMIPIDRRDWILPEYSDGRSHF